MEALGLMSAPGLKCKEVSFTVYEMSDIMYTNQSGPFPVQLSQRNQYIHCEPI